MQYDVKVINEMVQAESAFVDAVLGEVGKVIVGQRYMVERVLVGLLCGVVAAACRPPMLHLQDIEKDVRGVLFLSAISRMQLAPWFFGPERCNRCMWKVYRCTDRSDDKERSRRQHVGRSKERPGCDRASPLANY